MKPSYRSSSSCYLWISEAEQPETLTRCMGCVFDDNSQNNIMSDIDKHHGDSYSCDVQEQQSQLSQKLVVSAVVKWSKNG